MRTYNEALEHSKQNPYELVEFKRIYPNVGNYWTGSLLNGKREGVFELYNNGSQIYSDIYNSKTSHSENLRFRPNGSVIMHYFSHCDRMQGECKGFDEYGIVIMHYFYKSGMYTRELDYLVNSDRDAAFYFTLSMHGIEKEYTFQ